MDKKGKKKGTKEWKDRRKRRESPRKLNGEREEKFRGGKEANKEK